MFRKDGGAAGLGDGSVPGRRPRDGGTLSRSYGVG